MTRVAFLHYHLRPGGVTRVIQQQADALNGFCECMVLCGEPAPHGFSVNAPVHVVPGIGYDSIRTHVPVEETVARLTETIKRDWPGGCDVLHVHNATLAKNKHLLSVLKEIARRGVTLLIQIHDFAEDGRPTAFTPEDYPSDCHYAVINRRDHGILLTAGLKIDGLHYIPNMISAPPEGDPGRDEALILYPVRGIRRKNIGEAVLLSLFFPGGEKLGITQPPKHGPELDAYTDWKAFTHSLDLNVAYDMGLSRDFGELTRHCRAVLTTSVTEGFGFVFLEPWIWGKLLIGRVLPGICGDFEARGVSLAHMYEALWVPLSWAGGEAFLADFRECVMRNSRLYQWTPALSLLDQGAAEIRARGQIDFGLLPERAQQDIIRRVIQDSAARSTLMELNPFLTDLFKVANAETLVETNAAAVVKEFSPEAYRRVLLNVYEQVKAHSVRQAIDKDRLMAAFFKPASFSLLKWEAYAAHH